MKSTRILKRKEQGEGNRKNRKEHLSWAYVEAANIAKRYYPIINQYYQKKLSQTNDTVAIKAISNKLGRATYYILRDKVTYDEGTLIWSESRTGGAGFIPPDRKG